MASFAERMIGAAKLDTATYEEIEGDPTAMGQAMTVVVLSSLAAGIGSFRAGGIALVAISIVSSLIAWFVWAGLTYLIGTKVLPEPGTRADLGQLLRVIGFSSTPGLLRVLGFVPVLGALLSVAAGIWMLVAMVVAVRQALDYQSTGRAVGVCLIGFVIYMAVSFAVVAAFGGLAAAGGALQN